MNVYFGCSTKNILKHKSVYLGVRQEILKLRHTLTRDWVPLSVEIADKDKDDVASKETYSDVMSAIIASDVAIFDGTVRSMSIGHQLTFALSKRKPTLLIMDAKKGGDPKTLFIAGSKSSFLTVKTYNNAKEAQQHVETFLLENAVKSRIRFNLVLDKKHGAYLDWAAFRYKINKTDVIKMAIEEKMETDKLYIQQNEDQP